MHLCKKCLKVHRNYELEFTYEESESVTSIYEVATCSKSSCKGRIVEVDELILPTILELNKKGWTTSFCCSGHLYGDSDSISTYIAFDNTPPTIPDSFHLKDNGAIYYKTRKFNSSNRPNNFKRFNQLIDINRELYEWALGLPESS